MMMKSNEPASDAAKGPTGVATDPVGQFLSRPRRGEMTSAEYRDVLDLLALTQAQMAELLGVSIRTAHGYANGARIPEPVARLLALTLSLYERGRPARIEARP
jgi:DNA-binding XRE family transcriptional regulator